VGIDLDNKKAIDAVCNIKGKQMTIQDLARKTLVEMHDENPTRAHVYVYSEKPFPHVKSKSDNDKLIEIKGSEGIHICSGSIHKNGFPYRIIGTDEPMRNEEFVEHALAIAGIKSNEKSNEFL
jgi:bifunctional DNA primase/polymerase-like protein